MKLKQILKITLLTFCTLLTGFVIVLMYVVFFVENGSFEYSMLVPLAMILTGVLSVSYHFKTLKFYSKNIKSIVLKDEVLWIGNILFASTQIFTSLYLFYIINENNQINESIIPFFICFLMLVLGLCLIIEEKALYKRIIETKEQSRKNRIEDIKGVEED